MGRGALGMLDKTTETKHHVLRCTYSRKCCNTPTRSSGAQQTNEEAPYIVENEHGIGLQLMFRNVVNIFTHLLTWCNLISSVARLEDPAAKFVSLQDRI